MMTRNRTGTVLALAAALMALLVLPAAAKEIPAELPDPDGKAPDTGKPVTVYILAGQSNMLEMGNVLTVDTRDFWRSREESPSAQGYHYDRNAETYMLVGNALGRGMVKLLEQEK